MKLHCLGTAGYHPSETRHTSCYFLPSVGIVLDAGSGLFRIGPLIQTRSLDILLSHAHLDHVFGLTFLLGVLHRHPVERVRIWGESAKLHAIRTHLLNELIFPVELPVTWCPIDETPTGVTQPNIRQTLTIRPLVDGPVPAASVDVTWRLQTHPGQSVGYRLDFAAAAGEPHPTGEPRPKRMLYCTDTTGATDAATRQWMRDADVLMHECNFRNGEESWAETTGHCWVGRVAEIARHTQPRQVVLTHVNPADELTLADIGGRFEVPAMIAADGDVIDV